MPALSFPIQVYWEDTDAGGIVYHANYIRYMERARSDWLRQIGFSQNEERTREGGVLFVVAAIEIKYLKSAVLDDSLVVRTEIERLGRASINFLQEVWRGDERLVSGKVRVGVLDAQTRQPVPLPAPLHDKILSSLAA